MFQSSVPGIQTTIHYKTIVNIFRILCLIFLIESEKSVQVGTYFEYLLTFKQYFTYLYPSLFLPRENEIC